MAKLADRLKHWLYRGSFVIFTLLLIGFSAVLPIDSIAQASESENNAFNTFIVVGALVGFVVMCVTILIGRMIYYKSCLVDIPRRYLPITPADLPHEESREYVLKHMDRSKELATLFMIPSGPVVHRGLEPPKRCDKPNTERLFPEYLNYKSCIKTISNRLKYKGVLLAISKISINLEDTFSDVIYSMYVENNENNVEQVEKAGRLIEIYEYNNFSGKNISRQQFLEFVELCIYFSDMNITSIQNNAQNLEPTMSNPIRDTPSNTANNITPIRRIPVAADHADTATEEIAYFPSENYQRNQNSTGTVARVVPSRQQSIDSASISSTVDMGLVDQASQISKVDSYSTVIHR